MAAASATAAINPATSRIVDQSVGAMPVQLVAKDAAPGHRERHARRDADQGRRGPAAGRTHQDVPA